MFKVFKKVWFWFCFFLVLVVLMVSCPKQFRPAAGRWFAGKIGRGAFESEKCSGMLGAIPGGHFQGLAICLLGRRRSPILCCIFRVADFSNVKVRTLFVF